MASEAKLSYYNLRSWPHEWVEECREPILTLSFGKQEYGFYLLSIPTWIELMIILVCEIFMASLLAVPLYYVLVKKSRENHDTTTTTTTTMWPLLLTFGVYVPFWILAPQPIVEYLHIENKVCRFCFCIATPTASIFRLIEAYFGFSPKHTTKSLKDFCLYFGFPNCLRYDTKTQEYVETTAKKTMQHLGMFLFWNFITGMYQSMFHLHDSLPNLGEDAPDDLFSLRHVVDLQKWRETAFFAVLIQLYLTTLGEGFMFLTCILMGIETDRLMENPVFESSSPSDFWGRRWNLLIHKCLKGGVYKPVRSLGGSKATAVFAAFCASALFHEWLLPCIFFDYPNSFGRNSVFFAWQGMLVAMESAISCTRFIQTIKTTLPLPIRSLLVLLCGIPFGHWFLDSYVHSNFFEQGHMIFFSILPLQSR